MNKAVDMNLTSRTSKGTTEDIQLDRNMLNDKS